MHSEKMVSSKLEFQGNIITAFTDTVELENGKLATRDVIRHRGAACVAPLTENNELLFVKQFRYPVEKELLELPAGKLDVKGEDPLVCCKRELEEETGMRSDNIEYMGTFLTTPGFCDEKIELYLARDLYQGVAHPDEDEFLDVVAIPLEKAVEMVMNNTIRDGKTQALVLKVATYLKK